MLLLLEINNFTQSMGTDNQVHRLNCGSYFHIAKLKKI